MFSWNDALPNDVELTFVLSAFDQCKRHVFIDVHAEFILKLLLIVHCNERRVPLPFTFLNDTLRKVHEENETNQLLGRLATPDGKLWLKFLPTVTM
jgi:hypothetical protein